MKIEIRREQKLDSRVFYWIYADDKSLKCFYAGEMVDPTFEATDAAAFKEAQDWRDKFVALKSNPSITTVDSVEI